MTNSAHTHLGVKDFLSGAASKSCGAIDFGDLDQITAKYSCDLTNETGRQKPYQIQSPFGGSKIIAEGGEEGFVALGRLTLEEGRDSSFQHPMKSRFIETTPKYMLCSDRLGDFSSRESKSRALNAKYLAPNAANRIAWEVYDLDYAGAADAFDLENVVVPNFIAKNPENGHAQYGYALEVPVSTGIRSRQAPVNFLKAIRAGMTRRLRADINFKHGLGKNPLHADWRTIWLSRKPYSLHDMAVFLDTEEMKPLRQSRETAYAELGRNCSITSDLGKYGLRIAWRMRKAGARYEDFSGEMRAYASELNTAFAEPLGLADVRTIAKSVAKWAWSESTFEKFSEIQSIRAQTRRVRNEAKLDQVPDLASKSNAEIGAILGLKARAVRNYVAAPRAAYEASSIAKAAPWKAMSISRATYYRRKANAEI